jgi:putative endonuclease
MYYTYVLQSEADRNLYVGFTKNLRQRFDQHNKGLVESTSCRRPLKIIYYEACSNINDAIRREKYKKTHHGKMYLKKRLKSYLTGCVSSAAPEKWLSDFTPMK